MVDEYDYLIAGAGIAGLYTAYYLNKHNPTARICILEASNQIGGRLHTIQYDGMTFDAGGARFNNKQKRILALINELSLTSKKVPITSDIKYIPIRAKYDPILATVFPTINDFILDIQKIIRQNKVSHEDLVNTTLADFALIHYGKKYPTIKEYLISIYPYYAELAVLNALEGLNLFTNEFSTKVQYYILVGGLQQLATTIHNHLTKSHHIHIHMNSPLETITRTNTNDYTITTSTNKSNNTFQAKRVILALPKLALSRIKYLTQNKLITRMLNSVRTEPLYRIYARYPKDEATGKVWFADIPKVSTNLSIKYVIPIDYEKGLIMISYTDAKYAKYWMNQVIKNKFEETLTKQLTLLFPDKVIPKPKWYKHCYWSAGAGYWKPGYSRIDIMQQITKPFGDDEEMFICGENYSSHQAWVEGALETADIVLDKIMPNNGAHSGGKIDTYTMEEVAKHNKKTDAWIVIDGIVANITEWIPKHPGGDIILKGVGKDASKLFHSIGHDEIAKKMLNKYKIGMLE